MHSSADLKGIYRLGPVEVDRVEVDLVEVRDRE
jgi:hypothetical protein